MTKARRPKAVAWSPPVTFQVCQACYEKMLRGREVAERRLGPANMGAELCAACRERLEQARAKRV